MSTDRLRYFAAVVETKNIRKAAELVGIAPPSMSKAMAVLEQELGLKLLFPEGRGIGITPKGLEVYRLSAPLLEEHRRFFDRLKDASKSSSQIRMATFEVFSTYFISSFLDQEPGFDMLLLEKTPGDIEASILSGLVDVGLTYIPSPNSALEYREVGSFKMAIFGSKKWQNKSFDQWPFALPTTELKIHASEVDSLDMWPKGAPARTVKFRFELLETALQTTRMGHTVIHCPEFIITLQNKSARPTNQLIRLPAPHGYKETKPTKVYLVGRKGTLSDELERKIARFMRTL